jgi:DNA modification methylase
MKPRVQVSRPLDLRITYRSPGELKPAARNARTHSPKQIGQIATSIQQFGFVSPVLLDDDDRIVAGHGRVAAAKSLKLEQVPTIRLSHLSPAELRAYALADNRLAELAGWDQALLALELQDLSSLELEFDLQVIGFEGVELDDLLAFTIPAGDPDPVLNQIPEAQGPAVSRLGDVWRMSDHLVICGDARDLSTFETLMGPERARMMFTDPPYNVAIQGNVGGKGKTKRREFVMGSGEMSASAFHALLADSHAAAASVLTDGAISYTFMDWRGISTLVSAVETAGYEVKNVVVWNKTNAGMGTFYRSQHELIVVAKHGKAPHLNNFGLGETGRHRSNVWTYAGVNTFRQGRDEDLAIHPTVKPVELVADAILDVSAPREIVLDPFGGSGSTLIAAERTGRRARLVELDPLYVDAICRRFAAVTGRDAVLGSTGLTFTETAAQRLS